MDTLAFEEACRRVSEGKRLVKGIGTESEGSVHAVLKNYFETDHDSQETSVGRFIADIVGENGIIEIQTSHFKNLREKLRAFLPVAHVTVVYPVFTNKRLVEIDPDGSVIRARRSPQKGTPYSIFREVYQISEFLSDSSLSFVIMVLECDEYRRKGENGHIGTSVIDRFPTRLVDQINIDSPRDWEKLIPGLTEKELISPELARIQHIPGNYASAALASLYKAGILDRLGKRGRSYVYRYRQNRAE